MMPGNNAPALLMMFAFTHFIRKASSENCQYMSVNKRSHLYNELEIK